jgi:hypothetical protein
VSFWGFGSSREAVGSEEVGRFEMFMDVVQEALRFAELLWPQRGQSLEFLHFLKRQPPERTREG